MWKTSFKSWPCPQGENKKTENFQNRKQKNLFWKKKRLFKFKEKEMENQQPERVRDKIRLVQLVTVNSIAQKSTLLGSLENPKRKHKEETWARSLCQNLKNHLNSKTNSEQPGRTIPVNWILRETGENRVLCFWRWQKKPGFRSQLMEDDGRHRNQSTVEEEKVTKSPNLMQFFCCGSKQKIVSRERK